MSVPPAQLRDAGATAGADILQSRLTGLSPQDFARDVWARTALLTRRASDFDDLFSAGAADELISRRGLRTPFLRLAKDGATLDEASFTAPGGVGATIADQIDDTAVWRAFADGATLVLQALHRTWEPVADFSTRLGTELGHPVQANAYITPPQNRGFDAHYDVHDVFVLQIHGCKRWVIHEPVHPDPLRNEPWTDHRAAVTSAARGTPRIDTVLEPGDVLYLPRGWLHAARAQGQVSIHLTLGIHTHTRYTLAEQLAQAALAVLREDPGMRRSLPPGTDGPADKDEIDTVREHLIAALGRADSTPLFNRARRSEARPAPLGPLAQHTALHTLAPETPLMLRPALAARLDGTRLTSRAGFLDCTPADMPALTRLLDGQTRTADDIGLNLAARLLRAGILVPAPP
ncbi:cupin domain-containing protein [Streptomyces longisporoflavus]|uniref:Cupin domain-containing protein n=1 Tax=Streptomyces longisporoflavus TaxID=28044 RepID=A0ABW7QS03_9ACTN